MRDDMLITRRRLLATGSAAVGSAVLATHGGLPIVAAAQDSTPAAATGPLGGEIKMAYQPPATLNPLFSTAGADQGVERQIYGALVMMTHAPDPQFDLAESVDISEDAKVFTFHLREGLVFSDGVPLTSKDVLFTFHRAIDPRTGSVWRGRFLSIDGAEEYDGESVTTVRGLEAPDDRTVKMTLKNPDATWLVTLGDFAGFCILPEHAFGDIPPDQLQEAPFTFNPTPSAGAFVFEEWLPDQYLAIKRNDNYNPPKAKLDRLYLTILPQSVTALSQLQNGEIDIMAVDVTDMEVVQQNPNLTISTSPSLMLQWLIPNSTRPAFSDKRVRQAMLYALDREAMVREILKGQATVINSPFFGWEWEEGEPAGLNPYAYDPDKAKQLLAEANWDSGANQITMHYIPGNQLNETLINIIQQQYKDVGINFELMAVDVPDYTNRLISGATGGNTGDFDLILGSGGVMGQDPNVMTRYIDSKSATPAGFNYTHFANPRVDELLVQGRGTTDVAERKRIYTEVAQIINEDATWIFLWRLNSVYGVNKRVQGFVAPGHPGRVISSAHEWSVVE
ncbi:MAG: peptide/nickel transport system substrate-binding protein [Thermomicrobiales bacterium]|jgi:peptide/nickel transport system substrate-binding protein|nr:peptide/nickel transport system substrate-binding protein [Thermomicrobiales bacterium]